MTEHENFFAWLDGELEPGEAADMAAEVAADPHLLLLAQQHRALKAQLSGAFDPIAAAPVPSQIQATLQPSGDIIDLAAARSARRTAPVAQWMSLAATLAIGVLVGTMLPLRSSHPIEMQAGKIYAAAGLEQALDKQLASAPSGDVRVGVTFRDRRGEICRSFTQEPSSGLACRSSGRWQLKGIFVAPEGQGGDYRMASGMDPNLAALIDSTMDGEPFDAPTEKAAMLKGWR